MNITEAIAVDFVVIHMRINPKDSFLLSGWECALIEARVLG